MAIKTSVLLERNCNCKDFVVLSLVKLSELAESITVSNLHPFVENNKDNTVAWYKQVGGGKMAQSFSNSRLGESVVLLRNTFKKCPVYDIQNKRPNVPGSSFSHDQRTYHRKNITWDLNLPCLFVADNVEAQ